MKAGVEQGDTLQDSGIRQPAISPSTSPSRLFQSPSGRGRTSFSHPRSGISFGPQKRLQLADNGIRGTICESDRTAVCRYRYRYRDRIGDGSITEKLPLPAPRSVGISSIKSRIQRHPTTTTVTHEANLRRPYSSEVGGPLSRG